jgi:hypothetical protein
MMEAVPEEKKKVYQKPQVTEVKLVAQEAVLSNCKDGPTGTLSAGCPGDLTCNYTAHS